MRDYHLIYTRLNTTYKQPKDLLMLLIKDYSLKHRELSDEEIFRNLHKILVGIKKSKFLDYCIELLFTTVSRPLPEDKANLLLFDIIDATKGKISVQALGELSRLYYTNPSTKTALVIYNRLHSYYDYSTFPNMKITNIIDSYDKRSYVFILNKCGVSIKQKLDLYEDKTLETDNSNFLYYLPMKKRKINGRYYCKLNKQINGVLVSYEGEFYNGKRNN